MTENKTHGGARSNSGRKPVSDKKEQVTLYIPASHIAKHGGMDLLKIKLEKYILRGK